MDKIQDKARQIKMFIMDVDGVMTEGSMIVDTEGKGFKIFNSRDGVGIELLHLTPIIPVIITKDKGDIVSIRAKRLRVTEVYQGIVNKADVLDKLLAQYNLDAAQAAYIGDDLNDLPIMKRVGLAIAVADGAEEVVEQADYVTEKVGGKGAIREVITLILKAQEIHEETVDRYVRLHEQVDRL
ncbi:MAG: HAD hydrolase family protein [bacterium]|nr:HAD hydrolase family protein [bacterium]